MVLIPQNFMKTFQNIIFYMYWGLFHWGHLAGNYGFYMGQEQCLQSWLGSVVISGLVMVGRQNIKHV